jgi:hypothetical protein
MKVAFIQEAQRRLRRCDGHSPRLRNAFSATCKAQEDTRKQAKNVNWRQSYVRLKKGCRYKKYTAQVSGSFSDKTCAALGIISGEILMSIQAISSQATGTAAMSTNTQSQQATGHTAATGQATSATQSQSGTAAQGSTSSASYSVTISNAARAAFAEATESSVQTAQEANRGDHQAQRLLAKEQANKIA